MRITSQKTQAHNQPTELNDALENYFSNTIILQLFVDADMVLRKFTPPAMRHFNLSPDDLGRHMSEMSGNIRFPDIREAIMEVIASSKGMDKEVQTADKRWYQVNILPYIIRKENRTNGVIITFIDINGQIEVLKWYEKLNKRYEGVIYALLHDIRGPLNNIEGLVRMLRGASGKEANTNQILEMLNRSIGNLRSTVGEFTEMQESSTDSAKTAGPVNLERMVEDVQLALKDKIHEANAQVRTEINESEITLPKRNVRSILYNLLSNAIKYKAPDRAPEIRIKTEKSDEYTVLSVSDNGLGIEEDKREVIFKRCTRLRNDVEGTGMGLFIVKRMVKDMGGKIEVESAMGKGTTFKVYFKGQQ